MVYHDACRVYDSGSGQIVTQVGDTGTDHSYWGRPENQTGFRPTKKAKSADILGNAAAVMASASVILSKDGASQVRPVYSPHTQWQHHTPLIRKPPCLACNADPFYSHGLLLCLCIHFCTCVCVCRHAGHQQGCVVPEHSQVHDCSC